MSETIRLYSAKKFVNFPQDVIWCFLRNKRKHQNLLSWKEKDLSQSLGAWNLYVYGDQTLSSFEYLWHSNNSNNNSNNFIN